MQQRFNRSTRVEAVAAVVLGLSIAAIPFACFGMLATVNACGPFADGCDNYGQTAPEFPWFALLFFVAVIAIVTSFVTLVVTGVSRRRHQSPAASSAGWYADPELGRPVFRYWDGRAWTEHTTVDASAGVE